MLKADRERIRALFTLGVKNVATGVVISISQDLLNDETHPEWAGLSLRERMLMPGAMYVLETVKERLASEAQTRSSDVPAITKQVRREAIAQSLQAMDDEFRRLYEEEDRGAFRFGTFDPRSAMLAQRFNALIAAGEGQPHGS